MRTVLLALCSCGVLSCTSDAGVDAGVDAGIDAGIDAGAQRWPRPVTFECTSSVQGTPPASVDMVWRANAYLRVTSSPRVADLNGDGVGDLLLGHGVGDMGAVAAYDGVSGTPLWRTEANGELYGSALVVQLDGDGVPDAVMAGRYASLLAVSGATGAPLWRFDAGVTSARDAGWFGFYSPQPVADVDGDGVVDLVTANGGDDLLAPFEARPPGTLLVMSGATGAVLARAVTPDGAETYMSPLLLSSAGGVDLVFGTGGETHAGSLWRAPLAALLMNDLSSATELVTPLNTRGVIAPPSFADVNRDGVDDIVVSTFDGRLMALDGATNAVLWSVATANAESYATPAVGFFDEDDVPDFASSFLYGEWEQGYSASRLLTVSGATGDVLYDAQVPGMVGASPVAFDPGRDGGDAVLFVESGRTNEDAGALWLVDPATGVETSLDSVPLLAFSTPWVGDLDCDGVLDLFYAREAAPEELDGGMFSIVVLTRLRLPVVTPPGCEWCGYLGSGADGHFRR